MLAGVPWGRCGSSVGTVVRCRLRGQPARADHSRVEGLQDRHRPKRPHSLVLCITLLALGLLCLEACDSAQSRAFDISQADAIAHRGLPQNKALPGSGWFLLGLDKFDCGWFVPDCDEEDNRLGPSPNVI